MPAWKSDETKTKLVIDQDVPITLFTLHDLALVCEVTHVTNPYFTP